MSDTYNSPSREEVAFKLLVAIASAEGKGGWYAHGPGFGGDSCSEDWILDTYAKCLDTINAPHKRQR